MGTIWVWRHLDIQGIMPAECPVSPLNTDTDYICSMCSPEYVKTESMNRQSHKSWLSMVGMLLIAMSNDRYPGASEAGDNGEITPEF